MWAAFVLLSSAIFLYPVRLTLDYQAVQSVVALPMLPLFAGLFYAWSALLLILLFRRPQESPWLKVAALTVFALVSSGLWIVATQGHIREAPLYAAQIDALKEHHHIVPQSSNFAYFQWPAAFLQVSMLSHATGLSTWDAIVVVQLIWNATFAVFLYLFFLGVAGRQGPACVGVLLVLFGSTYTYKLLQQFHPGTLGMVFFLLASTLLLSSSRRFPDGTNKLLLNLVTVSTVATHFVTSVTIFLIATTLTALQRFRQHRATHLGTAFVSFTLIAAWVVYVAIEAFAGVVQGARGAITQLLAGEILPRAYFHSMGSAYFGSDVPSWARVIRYTWFGGLFGLGGLIVLLWIIQLKVLSRIQLAILSLAVGAGAVGTIAYIVTKGEDTIRVLTYAPFPLVAVLLHSFARAQPRMKAFVAGAALTLILTLSLPSFLLNNNTVNLNSLSRLAEDRAGRFLWTGFDKGEGLQLNSSVYPWVYYVPRASFRFPHPYYVGFAEEQFLEALRSEARAFIASAATRDNARVWVRTQRDILDMRYLLGVDLADTRGWRDVDATLSRTNRMYDNGDIRLYAPSDG